MVVAAGSGCGSAHVVDVCTDMRVVLKPLAVRPIGRELVVSAFLELSAAELEAVQHFGGGDGVPPAAEVGGGADLHAVTELDVVDHCLGGGDGEEQVAAYRFELGDVGGVVAGGVEATDLGR